jgi:hypothetical protein
VNVQLRNMENDLTVIYYTCNREDESFEEKIRQSLLETIDDLPLISISQKPIDFGENICVGDVGVSIHNAWRQLQIGLLKAKTKFVCTAESDYLYPKEYFHFRPEKQNRFYIPKPLYLLSLQKKFTSGSRKHGFRLKPTGCEGAVIANRKFFISRTVKMFKGLEMWSKDAKLILLRLRSSIRFNTKIPTIMFKTDIGMTRKNHHRGKKLITLPYWGNANVLAGKYTT